MLEIGSDTSLAGAAPAQWPSNILGRSRRFIDPHSWPCYAAIGVGALPVASAVVAGFFTIDQTMVVNAVLEAFAILAMAWAARWIGFGWIATPIEMLMLFVLVSLTFAFCTMVLAATAVPLVDDQLRAADAYIFGFDRRATVALMMNEMPRVFAGWVWIYNSLAYTPYILVLLLLLTGKARRAWTVLFAMVVAMATATAFLLVTPAYGSPPYAYEFIDVFNGVRDGSIRHLDASVITGIVTFPSLHAAYGLILAWGFSWCGRLAARAVVLNLAVIASALFVGGHYLVDLIAGCVLGWAAVTIAIRVQSWVGRLQPRPVDFTPTPS